MTAPAETESERILREYERRAREIPPDFYSLSRPGKLVQLSGSTEGFAGGPCEMRSDFPRFAANLGYRLRSWQWLSHFETLHARRENLAAIDLEPGRASQAIDRFPGADIRIGDAARLPWPDESFDIVSQSTVFTSILDANVRHDVAAEMLRVLKPAGIVFWYDFLFNNPRNANVRGVGRHKIKQLFPNCRVQLRRSHWRRRLRDESCR